MLIKQTLTDIEVIGLSAKYGLADGHAYQDLQSEQKQIICELPSLWQKSMECSQLELEREFRDLNARLSQQWALQGYEHFQVCSTASQSIGLVATWLKTNNTSVGLVEPTFDNLALLLHRQGVAISPIQEDWFTAFTTGNLRADKEIEALDAIFLVSPNNPTGKIFALEQLKDLVSWCLAKNKTLILDQCFRFFVPSSFDFYELLIRSGVSFLSIEDTGKTWPTQDMKASMLVYSENIAKQITELYREIFLCISGFSLAVLSKFVQDTLDRGLNEVLWKPVLEGREQLRRAITDTVLRVHPLSLASTLSVEWLQIQDPAITDEQLISFLRNSGIVILPGNLFYWSAGNQEGKHCARVSLLKPKNAFLQGIDHLRTVLMRIGQ